MRNISKIVVFYTDGTVDEVPYYPSGGGGGGYGCDPNGGGGKYPYSYNTSVCPKCGISLQVVMGYSCPNLDCPTGMGPTMCVANY